MMRDQLLYFMAIIPPEPVYSYAFEQKTYFAHNFNSKAALKSPPHITLHMPFQLKEKKETLLINHLQAEARQRKAFHLEVNNFGVFEPRVIYLNVNKPDPLVHLQKSICSVMKTKLNLFNSNYKDQVFRPHITVAFRDLKKPLFYEAWEEYKAKKYNLSFQASAFVLLKHDGSKWQVHHTFELKP